VQRARILTSKIPLIGPVDNASTIVDEAHAVLAEIWFRRSCLEIVCRPALNEAAKEYADAVEKLMTETVVLGLMDEGSFKLKFKLEPGLDEDGKPKSKFRTEPDLLVVAERAAEQEFFRAARNELYSADISE
jgi:hypothetical protein